ncbi:hypothetical protein RvY_08952 [Ramazzottius varieornatus]|uniref:Uncharacterized protein n=1 Tax=Ramazzottius varieornatus TaxID=947166 RepID=A0A1D1VC90_RAMVA|nr:hypothetical protein RvY_08952 [Ramazzottius varieornatus]
MNLPVSGSKDTLLERYRIAVANMKTNGCGSRGVAQFVTSSDEDPVINVHLPTYDLRDNILLLLSKMEEAKTRKVREAVEAKYPVFTGVEMPIEANPNRHADQFPGLLGRRYEKSCGAFTGRDQKLEGEIKILRDSHKAILKRLFTLKNTSQRLLAPPNDTQSTKPSVPIPTEQPVTTPKFTSIAARKPQLPKKNGVPRKVRPFILKGTRQTDENTITGNPLQARGLPSRDFAVRGVPKHITVEQLSAYLQGIGVNPRFVRIVPIVPIGPDDTKSSTVGRIGIYTSNADVLLKAENWSSNMSIAPWKFEGGPALMFNSPCIPY